VASEPFITIYKIGTSGLFYVTGTYKFVFTQQTGIDSRPCQYTHHGLMVKTQIEWERSKGAND
jgi:hypothetical protein